MWGPTPHSPFAVLRVWCCCLCLPLLLLLLGTHVPAGHGRLVQVPLVEAPPSLRPASPPVWNVTPPCTPPCQFPIAARTHAHTHFPLSSPVYTVMPILVIFLTRPCTGMADLIDQLASLLPGGGSKPLFYYTSYDTEVLASQLMGL